MHIFASTWASRKTFLKVLSFAILTSGDLCGVNALRKLLKFISPLVLSRKDPVGTLGGCFAM